MMNHDVFISYSSKQKNIADGVCHYLEENGFKCWIAPRDIPVGSDYGDLIDDAIKQCKVTVLVFSEAASVSNWVRGEINVAFSNNKPILPFRIDNTQLTGALNIMLNQMHWIDAFPHYADRLPDLLSSICGLLGRQARKVGAQGGSTNSNGEKPNQSEKVNIINGHEYVDLGLPSGTLWATCNVGACRPDEYGDYFAWGEIQPKERYSEETYKYSKGDLFNLTKYCNESEYGYNGFMDNLITLQDGDDAATTNWGSGWCTPTNTQWEELLLNTISKKTNQNGVKGLLFRAYDGNSLFLPAADFPLSDFGYSRVRYWTSLLSEYSSSDAKAISFFSNDCMDSFSRVINAHCNYHIDRCPRAAGNLVRPVALFKMISR